MRQIIKKYIWAVIPALFVLVFWALLGNPFRIGDRVKYVSKKRPDLQYKVFKAMNYVQKYDRRRKCRVDTIELDNGVWVETSEVFANVDIKPKK